MSIPPSKAEIDRKSGKHQVDEQHAHILDAAEKVFLQKGIENTTIGDIARQAGVTRITLYRYFANRDEIAVKIQARMFDRINAVLSGAAQLPTLESHRQRAQAIIRNFGQLRDAFRYIGLFDRVYLDQASDNSLPQWVMAQLRARDAQRAPGEQSSSLPTPYHDELTVVISTVIWFLEKLALRGELTWSDPHTPVEQHLQVFEELIMGFFDRLSAAEGSVLNKPLINNPPAPE